MKKMTKWMSQEQLALPSYLIKSYKALGLSESEMMLIIHLLQFRLQGNNFPTPAAISERMSQTEKNCRDQLLHLIQKGFIEIKNFQTELGVSCEAYDMEPLYERLALHFAKSIDHDQKIETLAIENNLYIIFEQEFSRPLSPIEGELLTQWLEIDGHSPELIRLALKEAVLSSALSFRYIERILYDWKQKGIRSPEQANKQGEKIRENRYVERRKPTYRVKPQPSSYNWLEDK